MDSNACLGCGKSYEEIKTVFDKARDFYYVLIPYDWRPKQIYYRIKCWILRPYTTIKPRDLSHTYHDHDRVMHACIMEVAKRFVESIDTSDEAMKWQAEHNPGHYTARKLAVDITNWYYGTYVPSTNDYVSFEHDQEMERQLLENCKTLIEHSLFMWD